MPAKKREERGRVMPDRHPHRDDPERDHPAPPERPHEDPDPRRQRPEHDRPVPGHNQGGGGHQDPERKPRTYTPWLVVRYTKLDNGLGRPIPDKTVFWVSPDIWVESGDPAGNPIVGLQNFVHARVFNLGSALG